MIVVVFFVTQLQLQRSIFALLFWACMVTINYSTAVKTKAECFEGEEGE